MTPPQGEQTATDTIPSFLLKTYEILEVDCLTFRTINTVTSYAGPKMVKDSLSRRSKSSQKTSYLSISATATTPPLFDRYPHGHSAQHV